MAMGLTSSPSTFSRMIAKILKNEITNKDLFIFIDDAVVHSRTYEEHKEKLIKFFKRLRESNLKLQPEKCELLKEKVVYLGHLLSQEGVRPDPKKLEAVSQFPVPKTVKNVRQFLGLAGYYRRFIHNFSGIAKPLSNLLKKDIEFNWSEEAQNSFDILKEKLCSSPLLEIADFTLPFYVTTDASAIAIGGILSQGELGKDRPIGYVSRVLTDTEQRYDTYSKEALAIIYTVTQFRPYLLGRKFTIITDHKPLIYFKNSTDPTSRVSYWRLKLNCYTFEIIHRAGKNNVNADALSRNPVNVSVVTRRQARQEKQDEETTEKPDYRDKRKKKPNRPRDEIEREKQLKSQKQLTKKQDFIEERIDEPHEGDQDFTYISEQNALQDNVLQDEIPSDDVALQAIPSDPERHQEGERPPVPLPRRRPDKKIIEVKEQLFMRKDNYMYFIDTTGQPCDVGAKTLLVRNELPRITDVNPGEVKVTPKRNYFHFGIIVKDNNSTSTTDILKHMEMAFKVLKHLIVKKGICSVSIAKSNYIENVAWSDVLEKLRVLLRGLSLKLMVCLGHIRYAEIQDRMRIMNELHASAVGGHKGVNKTYRKIKQKYFWENLKEDVQHFIRKCSTCQLKKLVRVKTKQPMIITDTPYGSMEVISLDIVGPFPVSANGHNNILTIQCNFSKYCLAIPLEDSTAKSVADALVKRFICTFGAPSTILTDQGTNFMSSLMRTVAKKFRIAQIKTTAYHPQSNGSLERSHHSLAEYLKTIINKNENWDDCLELATFCYNTAQHEGHKFTPFELVFGRLARLPSSESTDPDKIQTYDEYVIELSSKMNRIQEIAREKLIDSKIRAKYYYDKKINPKEFRVGDKVWLLKGGKQYKLADQYEGPYTILEIMNNKGNVKIKTRNKKTKIVHVNRLRISYIEQDD